MSVRGFRKLPMECNGIRVVLGIIGRGDNTGGFTQLGSVGCELDVLGGFMHGEVQEEERPSTAAPQASADIKQRTFSHSPIGDINGIPGLVGGLTTEWTAPAVRRGLTLHTAAKGLE